MRSTRTQDNPRNTEKQRLTTSDPEIVQKLALFSKLSEKPSDSSKKEQLLEDKGPVVRTEMVECGKDRCDSCPHGPYKYKYIYEDGSIKSEGISSM